MSPRRHSPAKHASTIKAGHATEDDPVRSPILLSLALIVVVWYFILWALGLLGCYTARKRYRLRPRSPLSSAPASSVPGVSIIRPLKGLDANLYENLESTFTQEYPNYEIFLSVADEDDQALPIVRDLIAKYPNVKSHVIIGEEIVGVNPKVNNLIRAYRQAENDIVWVLDSNVSVAPGTLARSVDALDNPPSSAPPSRRRIALVHHVPFAFASEPTLGSRMEEAFLNTNHAKMYLAINAVAIESCVVGKSNLYRRSDVDRVDGTLKPITSTSTDRPIEKGLPAFGRFLAEDNMIASALWHELDLRHDLSCDVAKNAVGNMTLADYIWRRVRWVRVRKRMVLVATLIEPLTECIVMGLLAAVALKYLIHIPFWIVLPMHLITWLLVDMDVYASLAGHPVPAATRWPFIGAWIARELLALPVWMFAVVGNEVEWRGRKYEIMRNGEVRRASADGGGILRWFRGSRQKNMDQYQQLDGLSHD